MICPKCYLLYFKSLLDVAFIEFFDEFNDAFAKNDNDEYVLVKALDEAHIEKFFVKSIEKQLDKLIAPYDIIRSPHKYFIIGACNPRDNFLLSFKDKKSFPKKLDDMIFKSKYQLKYVLNEDDIKIDIVKFNQACVGAFNHFFGSSAKRDRQQQQKNNVVFITHKNLDCYSMFKVLKFIFGKSNCVNLHQQAFNKIKAPIIAVNDLIDKHINNKSAANKDKRFKAIVTEVQQFINLMTQVENI